LLRKGTVSNGLRSESRPRRVGVGIEAASSLRFDLFALPGTLKLDAGFRGNRR